ncbi:unnamed protein product, partial [marine sediment metagenome]
LKIMQEYEKILEEQNYVDEADIYLQAIKYKKRLEVENNSVIFSGITLLIFEAEISGLRNYLKFLIYF